MNRFSPRARRPEQLPGLPILLVTLVTCMPLALLFSIATSAYFLWKFVPEIILVLGSTMATTVRNKLFPAAR